MRNIAAYQHSLGQCQTGYHQQLLRKHLARLKNFEGFEAVAENMKNSVKNTKHIAQQMSGEGFRDMRKAPGRRSGEKQQRNPPTKAQMRRQNKG